MMRLVVPASEYLPGYIAALEKNWSPDNMRPEAAHEELAKIARDAENYIALQDDREAKGGPVTLQDGSQVARLPGFRRWMWDGEFCGVIGFRWQKGTAELPPHVLGHIGYSVVPWKHGKGYATRALALLLDEIRALGLPYVELTTDPDNIASQRVILANGGAMVERFQKVAAYAHAESLRWRIPLT
ncbi:MAG: GNAT family N-acetyltransferase [Rhizomicrobium sp.]